MLHKSSKVSDEQYHLDYGEYESVRVVFSDTFIEFRSVRENAARAIQRVENYVNTLSNTPLKFKKDIANIHEDIHLQQKVVAKDKNFLDKMGLKELSAMCVIGCAGTVFGAACYNRSFVYQGNNNQLVRDFSTGSKQQNTSSVQTAAPYGSTNVQNQPQSSSRIPSKGVCMLIGGALGVVGTAYYIYSRKRNKSIISREKEHRKLVAETKTLRKKTEILKQSITTIKNLSVAIDTTKMVHMYPADYGQFTVDQKNELAIVICCTKALGEEIGTSKF